MLIKNQIYEILIEDLGHSGEGIGKVDGKTVFVDGAIPGDKVRTKIINDKKSYGIGTLLEIVEPSRFRVEPLCPVSSTCGGCQIMEMDYQKQKQVKQSMVKETLERIGGVREVKILPLLGMKEPYHYRNKSQYPIRTNKGEIELGFFRKKSHQIVPIDHCYIDSQGNEELLFIIKYWIQQEKIAIYDEQKHCGNLRQIILRTAQDGKEVMVIFVTKERKALPIKGLIHSLAEILAPDSFSIIQNINPNKTNVILGKENHTLYGKGYITQELRRWNLSSTKEITEPIESDDPLIYRIYPSSFFQINTIQTEKLYSVVLDFVSPTKDDIIFDLYCGLGSISLFLAKKAKFVYGVEVVSEAIRGAKENAMINQLDNLEFHAGKTEEILPKLLRKGIKPDIVLLDPPRKGCEESVLAAIATVCPQKIVYVSCNPATLARDLKYLVEQGYQVDKVQPVDLFPHTVHVETVVLMSRDRSLRE